MRADRSRAAARGSSRLVAVAAAVIMAAAVLAAQTTSAPDRSQPPQPGPPPQLQTPPIHQSKLSNGIPVWVVEMHEVPVVQVVMVLDAGSVQDPAGKFGAASLTAAMLDEGAGTRSSLELADAVDFLGASLGAGSSYDSSMVGLGVPVARLSAALPLMADVLMRPTFPERELNRIRRERLVSMLQSRDNPSAIVGEAYPRLLFGTAHRFGTPEIGTPESLGALTLDDLRTFYREHYRPERSTLVVVGDVTAAAVQPLLESAFGAWRVAATEAQPISQPAPQQPESRRIVIVDKPGAPQSQIRIGGIGVARSSPDYFPLIVANTILGGSFTSRLNINLREQHGYAYGAGSGFSMRRLAGPFAAGAGVQTDKTAESLTEFFKELNGIRQPVPADELERAKNFVALGLPSDFETTGDLASRLQELIVYGLPPDYFNHYVEHVRAVTAADVQRVMQKYIVPDRFLVVVVGDAKTIRGPIEALNLGPVTVQSVDDVLGPPPKVTE